MKTCLFFKPAGLALMFLLGTSTALHADITVLLSVKFILNSDGTRPSGNISTIAGFDAEIARGNQILAATGRGYQLQVVEYIDIQPPAPGGQAADYWFNLPARANRATIEAAALAGQATWRWNGGALNMYVNNSSSGQCSFVGSGLSISFGGSVGAGTVLHEVGHFFNLSHTHAGDYADNSSTPPFTAADLRNGDNLGETPDDNPNITTRDQLGRAIYGNTYVTNATQIAVVNNTYENVMSYHNENLLLPVQMNIWTLNANGARLGFCTGRTWFVANGGSDGASGANVGSPFATVTKGVSSVGGADDVVLLRGGSYSAPAGGSISKPCTLRATGGEATLQQP